MKKLAITLSLVLALVIAAAVSLPALAETTDVTGTVSGIIEVTAPSGIALGTMTPGTTATGSSATNGSVKANVAWTLTVKDDKTPDTGYMTSSTVSLENEFQINVAGQGLTGAETGATVTDSATGGTDISFAVSQVVAWTDAPGDYSITITFSGALD